ncbi:hypothetical protein JW698_03410 [Candidatus Wolfebacteria bacterium]|nr:hypothetical protein [Candidatus Wolfebacteria bacterium]
MIFERHSKNKKILFVIFIAFFIIGIGYVFLPKKINDFEEQKFLNIGIENDLSENFVKKEFPNDYIEKAITDYLLTQNHFSWKTKENSQNFCAVENLNPEEELFPLYVWARCAEFIIQDNQLKEVSGMSGPAKINYPNEMSYYDLEEFSYEAPGDGADWFEDVKRIFPENIQDKVLNFNKGNNKENVNNKINLLATEWFNELKIKE